MGVSGSPIDQAPAPTPRICCAKPMPYATGQSSPRGLSLCGRRRSHWTRGYGAVVAKASWYSCFMVLGLSPAMVDATDLTRIVGGAEIALGTIALVPGTVVARSVLEDLYRAVATRRRRSSLGIRRTGLQHGDRAGLALLQRLTGWLRT